LIGWDEPFSIDMNALRAIIPRHFCLPMTKEPLNPALRPSLQGTKQSPIKRSYRAVWAIASFLAMTTVVPILPFKELMVKASFPVISLLFKLFIGTRNNDA
jgi:hypothetical protein